MSKAGLLLNTQYLLDCQDALGLTVDTEALWKLLSTTCNVSFKQKLAVCVEGDLQMADEAEFLKRLKLNSYRVDRTQAVDKGAHCQHKKCKYNKECALRLNCLVPTCPFANKANGILPGRSQAVGVSLATRMMQLCYKQDVRTFVVMPGDAPLESCLDVLSNDESVAVYYAYFSSCGDIAPELKAYGTGTIDLSSADMLPVVTLTCNGKPVPPPSTIPQQVATKASSNAPSKSPLPWEQQAADLAANDSLFFMDLKHDKEEEKKQPPKIEAKPEPEPEPEKQNSFLETLALMPEAPPPPTTTAGSAPPPIPGSMLSFDFLMGGEKASEEKEKVEEPKEVVPEPVISTTPAHVPEGPSLPLPLPGADARKEREEEAVQPPEPQQVQQQVQPQQVQPQQTQQQFQQQQQPQQQQQTQQFQQQQQQQQPQQPPQQSQPQPLPPNWTEVFDNNTKKPYFVFTDPMTRAQRTTWERPKPQQPQSQPQPQQQPQQPQHANPNLPVHMQAPVQQPQLVQPQVQQQQPAAVHMQQQQPQAAPQQMYPQQPAQAPQMNVMAKQQAWQKIQQQLVTYTDAMSKQGYPPTQQQVDAIAKLRQMQDQIGRELQGG